MPKQRRTSHFCDRNELDPRYGVIHPSASLQLFIRYASGYEDEFFLCFGCARLFFQDYSYIFANLKQHRFHTETYDWDMQLLLW